MEAAVERRQAKGSRIPLDVLVELMHEDYEEPFEADAVNVSLGGLSMRAPYLPDVGARMTCRFECPPTGERIEADVEVVWAEDTGAHTGEFGLRFIGLPDCAERVIRRMVGGEPYRPPPPADETIDEQPPTADPSVELRLDGVASPILARVIYSGKDGLAVEQDLPFLRLRTGVTTPDGRRGRIEAVELTVDGDTPKLLLDVSYDERSFVVPESDATVPDFIETAGADELGMVEPTREPTLPEAPEPPFAHVETVATPPAHARVAAEPSVREVPAIVVGGREPSQLFVTTPREQHESELAEALARASEEASEIDTGAPQRLRAIEVGLAKIRTQLLVLLLLAKIGPALTILGAKIRALAILAVARGGPVARRVGAAVVRGTGRAVWVLRERIGRRFPRFAPHGARRRTTSPPPRETNVSRPKLRKQKRDEIELEAPRGKGRLVLVAAAGVLAIGLGAYAFAGEDTEPPSDRIDVHREIAIDPASEQTRDRAERGPEGERPESAGTALAGREGASSSRGLRAEPPAQLNLPTAMGDPSREAGPMAAPTFPSLREGARPAGSALPEGSPYGVDVRDGAQGTVQTRTTTSPSTFGAEAVPNARTFLIRMSRPVDHIEGTPLTDGFRVRIPGSLSLDRAGPIASAHPFVERSMILNRGDHAELTIRFAEGRTPAYRVVARGSAIEIFIAE